MSYEETIFLKIKSEIQTMLSGAKISLFGSRANGNANEESDWDILILTREKPGDEITRMRQDRLFPLSVKIAAFINIIIVSEADWNTDPSYYALRQSVSTKKVMA